MTDISKCANKTCPIKEKCYRWTAPGDKYAQSYAAFKYYRDPVIGVQCDGFWPVKKEEKK